MTRIICHISLHDRGGSLERAGCIADELKRDLIKLADRWNIGASIESRVSEQEKHNLPEPL